MSDTLVVRGHKFRRLKHDADIYQRWVGGLEIRLYTQGLPAHWGAIVDHASCVCTSAQRIQSDGFATPEEALDFVISAVESHGNTFLRIAAKIRGAQ